MADPVRLGVTAVTSPLEVGADEAPDLMSRFAEALARAGTGNLDLVVSAEPVTDPSSAVQTGRGFYDARVDAIAVVAASWYEDYLVLDLLEECSVPIIAWSRPGMETGSLCGMQQLCYMLKQLDHPYCFLFEEVDSAAGLQRARDFAAAAALRRQLRRARIGHLGHRVEGMTETTPHELALKRLFGPRVVGIDSQVFLDRAAAVPAHSVAAEWQSVTSQVGHVTSAEADGIESMQVHRAMVETIAESGLSAVAVGCYPHLMGKVCLAASLLGEEGIPVACEGDVNGALGMLLLTRLTGEPVHNTDLLDPIASENAIVFSHCGSGGFSLATSSDDITLGPVRLMHQGVCCLFVSRPGPVTLLNIVPTVSGYRMGALFGEGVETDMVFPGNPLRVRFATDYRDILAWIAAEGLGHHWMAAYGDLRRPLGDFARMVGCEWVSPR
jgi:L-fucose isomerase-like protein